MNNDSERILGMLSEGKITVDEAERLLEALSGNGPTYRRVPDPISKTKVPDFKDEKQGARDERDRKEPMSPRSGVRIGTGANVSPDVKLLPGSVIRTGATINEGVLVEGPIKIGVGAFIGEGAHLMKNCKIGNGVNIGVGAKIGADAEIHMGAFIGDRAKIGTGATIGKGANIGEGAEVSPGSRVPTGGIISANTIW